MSLNIENLTINDLKTFAGYAIKISGRLNEDKFLYPTQYRNYSDLTNFSPLRGIYYSDSTSDQYRIFNFCGNKTFNFTYNNPVQLSNTSITGENGKFI